MNHSLKGRDLVSISDLSKNEIEEILATAEKFHKEPPPPLCKNALIATCFFEPSTRTRLSFEAAIHRLGGGCIGFSDAATTSAKKGESLLDSMRVIDSYVDLIVLRHPLEGSARLAADVTTKPLINAGDGANEHPTQTLVDLFTIRVCQGKIDGLHIAIVGDLKYGRTVHSLALALAHYSVRLSFISPGSLSLPEALSQELKKRGVNPSFHASFEELLPELDILYMTRVQKERFEGPESHVPHLLKKEHLKKVKKTLRILHPLPRLREIEEAVDETPYAYYFQQAALALPVRMAILAHLL